MTTYVKTLKTPVCYFVHCDLVDPNQNLFNGKKSNLLAKMGIKGNAFESVNYQMGEESHFRAASTGEHVNSLALSVKDENGELFDFRGQKIYFELMIF